MIGIQTIPSAFVVLLVICGCRREASPFVISSPRSSLLPSIGLVDRRTKNMSLSNFVVRTNSVALQQEVEKDSNSSSEEDTSNDNGNDESFAKQAAKISLEEKMKNWEATDDEIKAATLGGLVPEKKSDSFDVGLYIAFPFMVVGCLLFLIFPFVADKIDVSSVGPPPTS